MAGLSASLAFYPALVLVLLCLPSTPLAKRPVPTPPTPCAASCPAVATTDCDFYFAGSSGQAPPVFTLTAGANVDTIISTPILYTPTPTNYTLKDTQNFGADCSTTFVAGGTGFQYKRVANASGVFLNIRTTKKQAKNGKFVSTCVKLPVSNAQLAQTGGGKPINLNKGPKDPRFPAARWCIWFQVTYPQPL